MEPSIRVLKIILTSKLTTITSIKKLQKIIDYMDSLE